MGDDIPKVTVTTVGDSGDKLLTPNQQLTNSQIPKFKHSQIGERV